MDFIYVDNSNRYIEGRRVSAVKNGLAQHMGEATVNGIFDHGYTISFGKLYSFLTGNDVSSIKRSILFGSRPPPNDSIWKHAEKAGFELVLEDRVRNKEKKIDTGIATQMVRDAMKFGTPGNDLFVLVAGDSDYVPAVAILKDEGFDVEVVFWSHAARELRDSVAPRFVSLDEHLKPAPEDAASDSAAWVSGPYCGRSETTAVPPVLAANPRQTAGSFNRSPFPTLWKTRGCLVMCI